MGFGHLAYGVHIKEYPRSLNLLITRYTAINSGAFVCIDNDEWKTNGRVLGWSTERGYPFPIAFHQILVREDLKINTVARSRSHTIHQHRQVSDIPGQLTLPPYSFLRQSFAQPEQVLPIRQQGPCDAEGIECSQ